MFPKNPENLDIVYSKVLKVYLRSKENIEEQRFLRVSVECDPGLSPVCQKVLAVHLLDDDDPCFVFGIRLSEDDYKTLKNEQNLLVDFQNFFGHVVRLFDQCQQSDTSKFLLVMEGDGIKPLTGRQTLQVMEITNFKHLCHLSLPINGGTDIDIKNHMAKKIKKMQEENAALSKELLRIQNQLEDVSRKLDVKNESCNDVIAKCMEEKTALQSELTQELMLEKEKYTQTLIEMQRNTLLEKQCVEDKYQDIVKSLEKQISSLKLQLQTSMEKNTQSEFNVRELKRQLNDAEEEVRSMQKESTLLKKQNSELDSDYHEKERTVQSLRTRFAVLEQELKDKAEMLAKEQEATHALNEEKQRLENALIEKEGSLQRQQTSLRTVSEDFVKANEILTLHQTELVSIKAKLQLSTNIAFEQEKILETKTEKIEQVMELLELSNQRVQNLEEEEEKLKETLQSVEKVSDEKERRLRISEQETEVFPTEVIDRLNRRLHETEGQASGLSRWPNRGPCHRYVPKTTFTPVSLSTNAPAFVPATSGYVTRGIGRYRIGVQMPIRTTGPPHLGLGHHLRLPRGTVDCSARPETEATKSDDDAIPVTKTVGDSSEQVKETEPDRDSSVKGEQKRSGDDARSVETKGSSSGSKVSGVAGGILRAASPPPLSAYFSNVRKD